MIYFLCPDLRVEKCKQMFYIKQIDKMWPNYRLPDFTTVTYYFMNIEYINSVADVNV